MGTWRCPTETGKSQFGRCLLDGDGASSRSYLAKETSYPGTYIDGILVDGIGDDVRLRQLDRHQCRRHGRHREQRARRLDRWRKQQSHRRHCRRPGKHDCLQRRRRYPIAPATSTGNAILGNSIFANTGLGIDLTNNGVTANDAGDGDTGANNLQNFPVLTSAEMVSSTQVTIVGTINSTANSQFRIEFFSNTAQDGTGHGEGQTYLGFVNVTTDGSGNAKLQHDVDGHCFRRQLYQCHCHQE